MGEGKEEGRKEGGWNFKFVLMVCLLYSLFSFVSPIPRCIELLSVSPPAVVYFQIPCCTCI